MTRPYPYDLLTPVNPLYPVPMPHDHDCEIRPDPTPEDPPPASEERTRPERMEGDDAYCQRVNARQPAVPRGTATLLALELTS